MKLYVNPQKKGEALGDLFGIFFEDLNHAADGGLYAELVQNRSFEFDPIDNKNYTHFTAWEKIENGGKANLVLETGNPVSHSNPHYLGIDILEPAKGEKDEVGVCNTGFNQGIPIKEGNAYRFTCYAKREQSLGEPVAVSLRSADGLIYAAKELYLTTEWKKYELELTASATDHAGRLGMMPKGRGKVYFDFVSLFPKDVFRGRENGLRKDIAEALEQLHPKFMRFPGGCLVHDGSLDANARDSQYRWKNTIGPVEDRPARKSNWGYNQTLGLGYYEYFLFCEDIKAKPLPVIPAGYDPHHHRAAPLHFMQPWVEDALDLIEFANGGQDTVWGRKRCELGHPEPFHLEYLGIGNEEVGEAFFERFEIIYQAVHEKYPEIKIVGTSGPFAAGGEFERGWASARKNKIDFVDEHYYQSPEWFLANHHRYDAYAKEDPKVFLGEYATWGNTWYNALIEASYMLGLERNAGKVGLACYAPMLCNADYVNWKPDMLWFDNHQILRTANYYVQKLFMNHQGDYLAEITAQDMPEDEVWTKTPDRISGEVLLATDDALAEYWDISIVNEDTGRETLYPICRLEAGQKIPLKKINCINYTIRMKGKEIEGQKGFQIFFGHRDKGNHYCLSIGGWQNQDISLSEKIDGRGSELSQYLFSVEPGREYSLELKIRGRHIAVYVDGVKYQDVDASFVVAEPLYYSASVEEKTGDLLIKAVNVTDTEREAKIIVQGAEKGRCNVYSMSGWAMDCQNELGHVEQIAPRESSFAFADGAVSYCFPGKSFTVLRIQAEES